MSKTDNKKKNFNWSVVAALGGVILGFILSSGWTLYYENLNRNQHKEDIIKILFRDVEDKTYTAYLDLDLLLSIEKRKNSSKNYLKGGIYDIYVFNAYIKDIPLLHTNDFNINRILIFYRRLQLYEQYLKIYNDNSLKPTPEERDKVLNKLIECMIVVIYNGKYIMENLEKDYEIEKLDSTKEDFNKLEKTLISKYPEYINSINMRDGNSFLD